MRVMVEFIRSDNVHYVKLFQVVSGDFEQNPSIRKSTHDLTSKTPDSNGPF